MAHTNRHFRYFWRQFSKDTILYTEMVMADRIAELKDDPYTLAGYFDYNVVVENPLVLQLGQLSLYCIICTCILLIMHLFNYPGGNDPTILKQVVQIAQTWGFRHFNLNCGCPSNIVATESIMGAAMMLDPELTAECCAAMMEVYTDSTTPSASLSTSSSPNSTPTSTAADTVSVPFLSVKCRIGVNDSDSYEELGHFINTIYTRSNVARFQIHARKALLNLSTLDNRAIPPLRYDYVYRLITDFPHLQFELNGGVESMSDMLYHYQQAPGLSGVMVGRACVNDPYHWSHIDSALQLINSPTEYPSTTCSIEQVLSSIYDCNNSIPPSRGEILDNYMKHCQEQHSRNANIPRDVLLAPVYNLFAGEPCCDKFRRSLKKLKTNDPLCILKYALTLVPEEVLSQRAVSDLTKVFYHEKMPKVSAPMHSRVL